MAPGKTGKNSGRGPLGSLSDYIGNVSTAAFGGGIIALIASGLIHLLGRELRGAVITFLAIGLLLILLATVTGFETLRAAIKSRKGFYGINTTAMVLIFLTIASVIIFVGAKNNARFDVTSTRDFSLSRQSSEVLTALQQDVEAVAFFVPTNAQQIIVRGPATDLLDEYERRSSRFTYRIVDPELQPGEARRFGVNPDLSPGAIVFSSQGSLQPVPTLIVQSDGGFSRNTQLERSFTEAILSVTHTSQKTVYFLTRHGERDPFNDTEGTEYGQAFRELQGDNYIVRSLDLSAQQVVPTDAAVLVIASPKTDLLDNEIAPLEAYLKNGGNLLFLAEPETPARFRDVLNTWGVELGQGTVVDFISSVSGAPRAPLVRREAYNPLPGMVSPITQPISDVTFFQDTTAIIPRKGPATNPDLPNISYLDPPRISIIPLATSSSTLSWLETDPNSNRQDVDDLIGPLALGVSIEARTPFDDTGAIPEDAKLTQIVVFGDGDFASSRFITSFGNRDMFLNSVNWLAGDYNLISVRPKLFEPRLLILTNSTWNYIRWSSLLILPVLVALAGGIVWWRRR